MTEFQYIMTIVVGSTLYILLIGLLQAYYD